MHDPLKLCSDMPERELAPGDDILVENEKSAALYVMVRGKVEILKGATQINVVSAPGSIFGEVSVLLNRAPMATVRALEPSTFHVIEDAMKFLAANPELNLAIARLLAVRLNSVTTYLVDLKRQYESRSDHLGMVDEVLESILQRQDT